VIGSLRLMLCLVRLIFISFPSSISCTFKFSFQLASTIGRVLKEVSLATNAVLPLLRHGHQAVYAGSCHCCPVRYCFSSYTCR
jgi:hypothetical protein